MSKGFTWAQAANSAAHLAVLMLLGSGNLLAQQRLGRQQDLTPQQVESLRSQIQELGGRAIIGFKPVEAEQGMLPDGTPALDQNTVRILAESLSPMGVVVLRQFRRIPAVAVRMDPSRFEELLTNPNIDYVEPDVLHEPTGFAEVPDLMALRVQETPWGILRVNAPNAWAITKGAGAKLGIIDTGIDEDHPDLNVLGGINLITGGTDRADWNDDSPLCITHGTHVAGSAAALDNDITVVGVAPEAELYALRVFDPVNAGLPVCVAFTSDIIAALEWAVDNTMDVVNLSLGSGFPSMSEGDAVFATFSAGVLVVASAGNSATSVGFPAAFPHAIAVAAMDEFDFVAFFSSHGPEVDVAGPGVLVLSTFGGGGTAFLNGTSMASPHAAGVATLIRAASPGLSAEDVREILRNTADDIAAPGYDFFAGYGVVDAEAAVNAVGTTDLALSTVPGLLTLTAEPGGSPVTEAVEIRNVGSPGTINWTASADEPWLDLSAASGTATDVTPGSIDVTADPTGLAPGIYTGFVTVAGNAANSPVQTRVRFAVAPRIVLDASIATAGEIPFGGRTRFIFGGTAGQLIDIAVLTDFSHFEPLFDPFLRIYKPDGETVLTLNDDGFIAGIGFQSLVFAVELPEDGDYIAEVGSFGDFSGGGFIIKARDTGPILSLSPPFSVLLRAEQDGPSAEEDVTVFNLTGVGTLDFDVTTFGPWLSADPTSGTASTSGALVASSGGSTMKLGDDATTRTAWDTFEREREFRSPEEKRWFEGLELARQWGGSSESVAGPDAAIVTLIGDPTGLSIGSNFGGAEFASADGWLPPFFLSVNFHIYTPGMEIISDGHFSPWGLTTDRPDRAIGATADDGGSLLPIDLAGVLGPAVATGMTPFPADVTTGQDDNWYVGSRAFDFAIVKVMPDGSSETFVTLPSTPFFNTTGPDGEFYPTLCNTGEMLRISPDGSVIEPFGPPDLLCPVGVAYNSVDGNIYVAEIFGLVRVLDLDGTDLGVVATNVFAPEAVTVGPSGKVYITTTFGEVWMYDPSDGLGADAEFLGLAPAPAELIGTTVVDQWLVFTGFNFGEFYRFPVVEGPALTGDIVVRLDADDIVTLGGLAKSIPGEDFRIPLNIEISADATAVANYTLELGWDVTQLEFLDIAQGDFTTGPGSFIANTAMAGDGSLVATGAEPEGRGGGGGTFTLFTLDLVVDVSLVAGDVVVVAIDVTEVGGALNEDLLPVLVIVPGAICLSLNPMGDVTLDGRASSPDATQILRFIVGLPLAEGVDIDRGDVTGDGTVGVGDVVDILRNLVGLSVPESSRVDKPPLENCS